MRRAASSAGRAAQTRATLPAEEATRRRARAASAASAAGLQPAAALALPQRSRRPRLPSLATGRATKKKPRQSEPPGLLRRPPCRQRPPPAAAQQQAEQQRRHDHPRAVVPSAAPAAGRGASTHMTWDGGDIGGLAAAQRCRCRRTCGGGALLHCYRCSGLARAAPRKQPTTPATTTTPPPAAQPPATNRDDESEGLLGEPAEGSRPRPSMGALGAARHPGGVWESRTPNPSSIIIDGQVGIHVNSRTSGTVPAAVRTSPSPTIANRVYDARTR